MSITTNYKFIRIYKQKGRFFALCKNSARLATENCQSRRIGRDPDLQPNVEASGLKTTNQGFTLIEMLVAITVLLLSITGPLTIAAQAVFSANIAKDRLTAAYLAQEGIELVRQKRDTNAIQGNFWLNGLDACLAAGACYVGPHSGVVFDCAGSCPNMNFNSDSGSIAYGTYGYGVGESSIFTRNISIEDLTSGEVEEIRVTSEVEWQAGGRTHEVVLTVNLFNWR
jgi:prepilin-type N-terminal cleavage/methylation domain-containing protein